MKSAKRAAAAFGGLGVILAVLTLWLSIGNRNAQPVLVKASQGAGQCAQSFLDDLMAGDYAAAGRKLYGSQDLGSGADTESEAGKLIWQAFLDSMELTLEGEPYALPTGVGYDVSAKILDIPAVTAHLQEYARELLTQRVAQAENVSQIYDSSNNYREEFVMELLRDAVRQALQQDIAYREETITLTLTYENGCWWVVPDSALIALISGV